MKYKTLIVNPKELQTQYIIIGCTFSFVTKKPKAEKLQYKTLETFHLRIIMFLCLYLPFYVVFTILIKKEAKK